MRSDVPVGSYVSGGEIPVLSPLASELKPLISLVLRGSLLMAKGMTRALRQRLIPKIFF